MQQLNKTIQINMIAQVLQEEWFFFKLMIENNKKIVIYLGHSLKGMQQAWSN